MNKINWKLLIACFIIVYAVAFIGGIFTSPNTNTEWYNSIKPSITPPNYIFPIVWNILFFLIAISLYLVWASKKVEKRKIIAFFGINFVLNIEWSYIYFSMKNPAYAFFGLILLWVSILGMICISYKADKKATYLLIPYLLWVSFAGILNFLSI